MSGDKVSGPGGGKEETAEELQRLVSVEPKMAGSVNWGSYFGVRIGEAPVILGPF